MGHYGKAHRFPLRCLFTPTRTYRRVRRTQDITVKALSPPYIAILVSIYPDMHLHEGMW